MRAETERSGPKLGWSGAVSRSQKNRAERERGPRSGNGAVSGCQKNQVLTRNGKILSSTPLTCSVLGTRMLNMQCSHWLNDVSMTA